MKAASARPCIAREQFNNVGELLRPGIKVQIVNQTRPNMKGQ